MVKVPEVNVVRASEDFKSGKIDLLFFAVGAPKVQEISAAVGGLRVLPMEILPDSEARMKKIRPEYYFSTVNPAPHIAGIDKPTKVQTIDFIIGVGTHVKDDGGGRLHQGGAQQQEGAGRGPPQLQRLRSGKSGKVQPRLPYHPAAEKYLKESSASTAWRNFGRGAAEIRGGPLRAGADRGLPSPRSPIAWLTRRLGLVLFAEQFVAAIYGVGLACSSSAS